jgi:site-specific DNA recombinase
VRARIAHARDELAALEKVLAERHELQLVVARVEEFAQRLRKGLSSLSWEERRTVVRTLVARIEIADDDVTVVYRVPSAPTTSSTVIPESGPDTPDLSVVSQASTDRRPMRG